MEAGFNGGQLAFKGFSFSSSGPAGSQVGTRSEELSAPNCAGGTHERPRRERRGVWSEFSMGEF